jgi:hypothetical protein
MSLRFTFQLFLHQIRSKALWPEQYKNPFNIIIEIPFYTREICGITMNGVIFCIIKHR